MKTTKNNEYYFSAISQNIIIAVIVAFFYLVLGDGIYIEDSSTRGVSGEQSIVQFNEIFIIYLLGSLLIGSLLLYYIFTRMRGVMIRIVYGIILSTPFIATMFEIIILLLSSLSTLRFILLLIAGITLPFFTTRFIYVYTTGKFELATRNAGIIFAAIQIGRMMSLYFDLTTVIIFAIILSIFDVYSVFKGPLSKIMGKPSRNGTDPMKYDQSFIDMRFKQICKKGTPVLLSKQNTVLGIGDVLFFSILLYEALVIWQWFGLLITLVGVILGSLSTLRLLKILSPLPGLPLPVMFSMLGYWLLSNMVGL